MLKREIVDAADFGGAVRAARRDKGISQQELARACGCSQRFISELERGKPTAEIGKALDAARAVGLRVEASVRDPGMQGRHAVEQLVNNLNERLSAEQSHKSLRDFMEEGS